MTQSKKSKDSSLTASRLRDCVVCARSCAPGRFRDRHCRYLHGQDTENENGLAGYGREKEHSLDVETEEFVWWTGTNVLEMRKEE